MSKANKKGRSPAKKPHKAAARKPKAPEKATHAEKETSRVIASDALIREACTLLERRKGEISDISGDLGNAMRGYADRGINLAALRDTFRLRKMGRNDGMKLRIHWDDLMRYMKVLKVQELMARDLFKDSGKRRPQKDNGRPRSSQPKGNGGARSIGEVVDGMLPRDQGELPIKEPPTAA